MWTQQVLIFLFLNLCEGVIYRLSDEDYNRMPPVFRLDDFDTCLQSKDGLYCTAELDLVSEQPSELLNMITEYSAHYTKHYNHTNLKYGICLSQCENYNPTKERMVSLESCLNSTLWKSHKLKTKIVKFRCTSPEKKWEITTADICFAVFLVVLITLHIAGSMSDYLEYNLKGLTFLEYFSVQRNWCRLVAPASDGPDPRLARLKCLHGVKLISELLAIVSHSWIPVMIFIDNTRSIESTYDRYETHILINGSSIVQAFFIVTGFLRTYMFQIHTERNRISWKLIPQIIFTRWLRLLPPYAFILAFTSTWIKFMGSGPLWDTSVTESHDQCKKNWWKNLLYINNYDDDANCYIHTWYLACDMQLTIVGAFILVASKMYNGGRYRYKIIVWLLTIAVFVMIGTICYYDLDGTVLATPTNDKNFNLMYKRGHTNLFGCALGIWMGYYLYDMQKKNIDVQKYKKYKLLYWGLIPTGMAVCMAGKIFFNDGPRLPLAARLAYGFINKIVIGIMVMISIMGIILKYEGFYRRIVKWFTWVPMGRICYCAYLVHITVLQIYIGSNRKLNHVTYTWMVQNTVTFLAKSFVSAALLWLFVEAPFTQIINRMTRRPMNIVPKNEDNASNVTEERDTKKVT